jgi:hypothetical protein
MLAGGALFVGAGGWAFLDPASFYAHVATFPPYNRHFLHDLGAFQVGLGTALFIALLGMNARAVALWAVAVASVLHAVSHVVDRDLGGRDTDPIALSEIAAAFVCAALLATRRTDAGKEVERDALSPPPGGVRADRSARTPQRH